MNLQYSSKNSFILSKYQVRNNNINEAIASLSQAIDEMPELAIAVFKEIDLLNEPEVLKLIEQKNILINKKIDDIIEKWSKVESTKAQSVISLLNELKEKSYEIKIKEAIKYTEEANATNDEVEKQEQKIDELITLINNSFFINFSPEKINEIIIQLNEAKKLPLEKMQEVFNVMSNEIEGDRLKIGAKYAGGIVFHLDETGLHGLVCAENDLGSAVWGGNGVIGTSRDFGSGKENTKKIVEEASWYITKEFFSTKKEPAPTAARICKNAKINGFKDWYLPSIEELESIKILYDKEIFIDSLIYWSSSERHGYIDGDALVHKFLDNKSDIDLWQGARHTYELLNEGLLEGQSRDLYYIVRPIRKF